MNNDKFTLFHIFNTIQKPIVLYIIKNLDLLKVIIEKIKNNIQKIINDLYAKWEEIKPTPLGKKIIKYTQTPYLIAYLFMTIVLFFIIRHLITKIPERIINNIENAINNFINSIKNAIINFVPGDTYNMKLFVVISIIVLFIMYKTGVLQFLLKYIGQFVLFLMYLVNIRTGTKISVIFIAFVIFCFMAKLLLERIKTINDKKKEINNITKERTDSLEQLKKLSYQVKGVNGQVNEFKDVIKDQMNDININKKMCKKNNTLLNIDYTKLISNVPSKIDDIISSSIKDNTENLRKMKREVEIRKKSLVASRNNEINKINNEIINAKQNDENQERLQALAMNRRRAILRARSIAAARARAAARSRAAAAAARSRAAAAAARSRAAAAARSRAEAAARARAEAAARARAEAAARVRRSRAAAAARARAAAVTRARLQAYSRQARLRAFFRCLVGESKILMKDNKYKEIKNIKNGDIILNENNKENKVMDISKNLIKKEEIIYGINNIEPFFNESHPIISINNIVLSINPEKTLKETPERKNNIKKLEIGDTVFINNKPVIIHKITKSIYPKDSYIYDLTLENMENSNYIANNVLVGSQEPNYYKNPNLIINIVKTLLKEKDFDKNKNYTKDDLNYYAKKIFELNDSKLSNKIYQLWCELY